MCFYGLDLTPTGPDPAEVPLIPVRYDQAWLRILEDMSMAMAESLYRTQVLEEVDKLPTEFLPSLLKLVQAFREGVALPSAEASFRHGWQEAISGQTYPIAELWKDVDAG